MKKYTFLTPLAWTLMIFLGLCTLAWAADIDCDADSNSAMDINKGGTNATTEAGARTALGLAIGTNVQAYDADLTTWGGLTPSAGAQAFVQSGVTPTFINSISSGASDFLVSGVTPEYVNTITSDAQAQLDARCLESVFGTAIGTGLLLDGTTLKASAILQEYHGANPTNPALAFLSGVTPEYVNTLTSDAQAQIAGKQTADADLTTWAGITPSANLQTFLSTPNAANFETAIGAGAFASDLLGYANAAAVLAGIGAQAADADLTTYAGITPSAGAQAFLASGVTPVYVSGVTENVQLQINQARAAISAAGGGEVEDAIYSSGWNTDTTHAPSQNALYDYLSVYMMTTPPFASGTSGWVLLAPESGTTPVPSNTLTGISITTGQAWEKNRIAFFDASGALSGATEIQYSGVTKVLDLSGVTVEIQSGVSPEGVCQTGWIYLDTNEDTNGSLLICVATGQWKDVDDDGAAGAGDFMADGSVPMTGAPVPNAANTIALGSDAAEWADLYLGDGAIIYGQNDQSATLTSSASLWTANNFSVTTQLKLPSSNADPTATAGYVRHDSTITNFTNGGLVYYNGAAIKQLVDMTTATAQACTDNQVVAYDADADLWYCKDDADSAGATALDDIGDPDAATSISMGNGESLTLSSAEDTGSVLIIDNTDADLAGQTILVDLKFTGDVTLDSADHVYLMGTAYGAANVFSITAAQTSWYRPVINYAQNAVGGGLTFFTAGQTLLAMNGADDYVRAFYAGLTNADHSNGNIHAFEASIDSNDAQATQIAFKVTGAGFWDYDIMGQNGETIDNATNGQWSFGAANLVTTGSVDFGGAAGFEIPNGADPTVNAIGEIAIDTTANQIIMAVDPGSGVTPVVVGGVTEFFTITISGVTNVNDVDDHIIATLPYNITVKEVSAKLRRNAGAGGEGTTTTINVQECTPANSCADLIATDWVLSGATTATLYKSAQSDFSDSVVSKKNELRVDVVSGCTDSDLTVGIVYWINRE